MFARLIGGLLLLPFLVFFLFFVGGFLGIIGVFLVGILGLVFVVSLGAMLVLGISKCFPEHILTGTVLRHQVKRDDERSDPDEIEWETVVELPSGKLVEFMGTHAREGEPIEVRKQWIVYRIAAADKSECYAVA